MAKPELQRARILVQHCIQDYTTGVTPSGERMAAQAWAKYRKNEISRAREYISMLRNVAVGEDLSGEEITLLDEMLAVLSFIGRPAVNAPARGGNLHASSGGLPSLGKRHN